MKYKYFLSSVFFLIIIPELNPVFAQIRYEVINLGVFATPSSINDSGQVVFNDGIPGTNVIWHNGTTTSIGTLGNEAVYAFDINDSAKVVGEYAGMNQQAFISHNGNMTALNVPSNITSSIALGINNSGSIVGAATADTGGIRAVKWDNGNMQYLGYNTFSSFNGTANDINASGQIVGTYDNQNFQRLGFLWQNGNLTEIGTTAVTRAYKINASGHVVGETKNSNGDFRAFLWENGNLTEIISPGYQNSVARDLNDSTDIVGFQWINLTREAFLREDGIIYNLNELSDTSGGWILEEATGINNFGYIIGRGRFNGQFASFLLKPSGIQITNPKADDKWIAGETDTIKWSGGSENQLLQIEFSVDSGSTFEVIDFGIEGDTGVYAWDIPEDILSKKCMIRIYDMNDTTIVDTSDVFKIKGYILTRDSSGQYEPFRTNQDQWGYSNIPGDMWPQTWYQQFDYQGIDPFTNSTYSQWQGNSTFASAKSKRHPDWVSWVNAFSENACYVSTLLNIYNATAVIRWGSLMGEWEGSCFGIAAASSLAFKWKDQFLARFPPYPEFDEPINVNSNDGVKKVVNELFTHQFGNPSKLNDIESANKTPNQTLNELKQMLLEDETEPKTITIFGGDSSGAHTILAYRVRRDPTQNNIYYVDVYDNSEPTSNNPITIDTTGNGNNGTWSYPERQGWNGKFYLEITSNQYLNGASLPKGQNSQSPFLLTENILEINLPTDSQIEIRDLQGNTTGFVNNQVLEDIPGSVAQMIKNGSEGPPYGYLLLTDNYSVTLNAFESDTVEAFFFTGNKSFVYERSGAVGAQTDRLFFDGGVSVANPDAQTKTFNLLNIINENTLEKLFSLRSLELAQNDSFKIDNPDSNKVKLISYGSAKDYDIELNYVTENGLGRFGDFNIPLSANTSHTFVPEWTNLTNSQLIVLVDIGNNGTIDDTLYLSNTVSVDEQGSLFTPNSYHLAQNYPNPFNPVTTILYSIPKRSTLNLTVYDMLGKEVATLVNEEKDRGVYTVNFDATNLSSGIYFYRIQAGSFNQVKKMILLR